MANYITCTNVYQFETELHNQLILFISLFRPPSTPPEGRGWPVPVPGNEADHEIDHDMDQPDQDEQIPPPGGNGSDDDGIDITTEVPTSTVSTTVSSTTTTTRHSTTYSMIRARVSADGNEFKCILTYCVPATIPLVGTYQYKDNY